MKRLHSLFLIASLLLVCLSISCKKQPDKELDYKGVSFKYKSYWKAEAEQLSEDHYFIKCEEKFDKETIFFVSFFVGESDPEALLDSYFNNIEGLELTKDERVNSKFGQYDCLKNSYQLSKFTSKFYGECYAFNAGGMTLLVIKQSADRYDLKHDKFKTVEDSFRVFSREPISEEGAANS